MGFWLVSGIQAKRMCELPVIFPALLYKKHPLALGECVLSWWQQSSVTENYEALVLNVLKKAKRNKAARIITPMFSVNLQSYKYTACAQKRKIM